MASPNRLAEDVKRFGYAKTNTIKLYGRELQLVSDPVNRRGDEVFVDAREEGTDRISQVQIPRNVVQMAKNARRNGGNK